MKNLLVAVVYGTLSTVLYSAVPWDLAGDTYLLKAYGNRSKHCLWSLAIWRGCNDYYMILHIGPLH